MFALCSYSYSPWNTYLSSEIIYLQKNLEICIFSNIPIALFGLISLKGQLAVDQKVNICWPKFQILKNDVSALCIYFYVSQNPFPRSQSIHFSEKSLKMVIFVTYDAWKGISVLPKKSTHVDQILRSTKMMYWLFLTIFIAPGTHLWAQKSLVYWKIQKIALFPTFL